MINFGKKKSTKGGSVPTGPTESRDSRLRRRVASHRTSGGEDKKPSTEERKMYKAVCFNCGNKCELPFKPTGDKPVFCSDCYKERINASSRRSNAGGKKMYQAICSNCGNRCEVPFSPTGDKPVFCSNCYGKGGHGGGRGAKQSTGQFDILNTKLDKILEMLSPEAKSVPKEEVKKAEKKETKKAVNKPIKKAAKKTPAKKKIAVKKKK